MDSIPFLHPGDWSYPYSTGFHVQNRVVILVALSSLVLLSSCFVQVVTATTEN